MNRWNIVWGLLAVAIACVSLSGCESRVSTPPPTTFGNVNALLPSEPEGARGVLEVRRDAKDGEEVTVVGRIGGSTRPWIDGRAGFQIVDAKFKPCNEREDDQCPTPWDYCCDPREELVKGMATIKVVDAEGKTVPVDARKMLGVKELQTVVVKGTAKREEGNLTVLATGVYVRP